MNIRQIATIASAALLTACGDPKSQTNSATTNPPELSMPAKTIDLQPVANTVAAIQKIGDLQEDSFRTGGQWLTTKSINAIRIETFNGMHQDLFGNPAQIMVPEALPGLQAGLAKKGFLINMNPVSTPSGKYLGYNLHHIGEVINLPELKTRAQQMEIPNTIFRSMTQVASTPHANSFYGTVEPSSGTILLDLAVIKRGKLSILEVATNELAHRKLELASSSIGPISNSTHETYSNYVSFYFAQAHELINLTLALSGQSNKTDRYLESSQAILKGLDKVAQNLGFANFKAAGAPEKMVELSVDPKFAAQLKNAILSELKLNLISHGIPSNLLSFN